MKKSLLIGALSAAALLVGGTVAAFVVQDNAGAKTATIQIGTIEGNVVTLDWANVDEGDAFKTSLTNLLPGDAQSLGHIRVKASGKDASGVAISKANPYTGYLDLSLDENYGGRLTVFAEEVGATEDLEAVKGTAATLTRYSVEVASEKEFEIFVQLSGVVTNQDIAAVSGKEAILTVDWRDVEQQAEPQPAAAVYTLKVGDGEPVALAINSSANLGEYMEAEYFVEGIDLTAGQTVTFFKDSVAITNIGPDDNDGGLLGQNGWVNETAEGASIFLKVWKDGGYSYWAGVPSSDPVEPTYLTGTVDLYFTNSKGWEKVYFYAWKGTGENAIKNADWPGIQLTDPVKNEYQQDVYKVNVKLEDYDGIIFNNGLEGDDCAQTVDIDPSKLTENGFYLKGESSPFEVGSWTQAPENNG